MRRWALVAAVAACAAACPPARPPALPGLQFWSLVKVTTDASSFAFKCLHAREGGSVRIECFSPVEVPLFGISMDGNAVVTEPASQAVASQIPFDLNRIGADVWRVHAALSGADVSSFNELSDPDLPEDGVVVERDGEGRIVEKTFLAGKEIVATAVFSEHDGPHAGRIVFESVDPPYTIEIVQGEPSRPSGSE